MRRCIRLSHCRTGRSEFSARLFFLPTISLYLERPRSLSADPFDGGLSVTKVSGTKLCFFNGLRINASVAFLFVRDWTRISSTSLSQSGTRHKYMRLSFTETNLSSRYHLALAEWRNFWSGGSDNLPHMPVGKIAALAQFSAFVVDAVSPAFIRTSSIRSAHLNPRAYSAHPVALASWLYDCPTCSLIASKNVGPKSLSFLGPTPLTCTKSSGVFGHRWDMCCSVASEKMA